MSAAEGRTAKAAACAILLATAGARGLAAWEPPAEAPRTQQSGLTAVYAPSFGLLSPSAFPLLDNFSVEGSWVNLFPKGQNLNFWFGISHSITDMPLYASTTAEVQGFGEAHQSRDRIYGRFAYVFYDYFQFIGQVAYDQNRLTESLAGWEDYSFDRLGLSGELAWDLRYSSIENYYKGKVFIFPEQGFRLSAGFRENIYLPGAGMAGLSWSPQAYGAAEVLFHPHPFWVISLNASGQANIGGGAPRSQATASSVLGALDAAGDYAVDAMAELRFLHPSGVFWESPEFWYVSSFLFKFSPGFALGYDAGMAGRYGDGSRVFQESAYASAFVAVRMNGELLSVLRVDFAAASSGLYKIVLSASFGLVSMDKSSTMAKVGVP